MIASWSHGFIFVKTRKTASTSVEIALSIACSGRDICTPISDKDEAERSALGGAPRNFKSDGTERDYYNHMPAAEIACRLPELWSSSLRFAIERHPYEKVISRAWWNLAKRGGDPAADVFVEIDRVIATRSYIDRHLYCIDDVVAVNELVDHATLWPRLMEITQRLGIALPAQQPRAKVGHRRDGRPARLILNAAQRTKIQHDAAFEFSLMGYAP